MKYSLEHQGGTLQREFSKFMGKPGPRALLRYLKSTNPTWFDALSVPPAEDGMTLIGESGRPVDSTYLFSRWSSGRDPGVLREHPNITASRDLWDLPLEERKMLEARWNEEMVEAQADAVLEAGDEYNDLQAPIGDKFQERTRWVLNNKRIITCTTTGAAIYRDAIRRAGPQILVVEEAGEVQESHIPTAFSWHTERMILIGDHKYVIALLPTLAARFADTRVSLGRQLRQKVNSYELTVEKGDGYDLNRSLFERLVIEGHPYRALSKQHRMRPKISSFVRHLTYPDLTDGPGTQSRPALRGLQNPVIFIDHKHQEDDDSSSLDPRHLGTTTSKNKFEVEMVVKIVGYLEQQGCSLGGITVLTPYLGQLVLLRETLEADVNNRVAFGERDTELLEMGGLPSHSKCLAWRIRRNGPSKSRPSVGFPSSQSQMDIH